MVGIRITVVLLLLNREFKVKSREFSKLTGRF